MLDCDFTYLLSVKAHLHLKNNDRKNFKDFWWLIPVFFTCIQNRRFMQYSFILWSTDLAVAIVYRILLGLQWDREPFFPASHYWRELWWTYFIECDMQNVICRIRSFWKDNCERETYDNRTDKGSPNTLNTDSSTTSKPLQTMATVSTERNCWLVANLLT